MFLMRLALQLGATAEELAERMTADEFDLWKAFYLREPFGAMVEDHRAGLYPLMRLNSEREKNKPPYELKDVFPWHRRQASTPPKAVPPPSSATYSSKKDLAWALLFGERNRPT